MQANKNAFFYLLDRATGELISATPFASMTWATGMDSTGRPMIVSSAIASSANIARTSCAIVRTPPSAPGVHHAWHTHSEDT